MEEKEKKKNSNFVMMYRDHMPEMRWLMRKSGIAASIFNFILEHMDTYNALVCSHKVFAEAFDVSTRTVDRCVKLLYDNGFIDILKSGTSNVYVVNQELAWTTWENEKEYCAFNGKILLSASEQDKVGQSVHFDRLRRLKEREGLK